METELNNCRSRSCNLFKDGVLLQNSIAQSLYKSVDCTCHRGLSQAGKQRFLLLLFVHPEQQGIVLPTGAGDKPGGTPSYTLRRTRDAVDDRMLRQLAGVEPYQATDIRLQPALLELSEEELRAMLQ